MLPPWLDPIDPSRSPAAPPAPPTPSPQPRQKPPARPARGERTNLVLLAAAAGIALVAGIVWGIVTGGANSGPATATQPTPTHGQAVGATMFPSALQASYRPVSVTVTAGSAAEAIVSWSAPAGSDAAVDSYLVGYNHFGVQEPPVFVSRAEHSVRIKGLKPGTHYEFTVSALILLPGDPADHLASSAAVGFDTAAG